MLSSQTPAKMNLIWLQLINSQCPITWKETLENYHLFHPVSHANTRQPPLRCQFFIQFFILVLSGPEKTALATKTAVATCRRFGRPRLAFSCSMLSPGRPVRSKRWVQRLHTGRRTSFGCPSDRRFLRLLSVWLPGFSDFSGFTKKARKRPRVS